MKFLKRCRKFVVLAIGAAIIGATFYAATDIQNEYLDYYEQGVSYLEENRLSDALDCFKQIPKFRDYRDISERLEELNVCPECGHIMK